jgi:UDP-glucose 4-epimerase
LQSVRLRYFNAAGADPSGEIGEDHDPETHLIPLLLDAAMGRREAISIFGTDYPTPDGTAIRDYVHVCDLASAHVKAADHLLAGGETLALNLGSGRGLSVAQMTAGVKQITGRPVPVRSAPRRPGDPAVLVADHTLARAALGWSAQRSDLETIVQDAWAWHTKRFG